LRPVGLNGKGLVSLVTEVILAKQHALECIQLNNNNKSKRGETMSFAKRLISELSDASNNDRSLDPFDFPEETSLEDNQRVEPICSTYTNGNMVNIYKVEDGVNSIFFIYSIHGDGGTVLDFGGPFASLDAAKGKFGKVKEGWTFF
jgi:hypothetical protein